MWISATNFKQLKTVLYKQYKCCYFSTLWGSKSVCYISKFVIITEIIISKFFLQGFVKNIYCRKREQNFTISVRT